MSRVRRLRRELKAGEAALIITPVNRRYFTGFPSSDGYLYVSPEKAVLLADGRYIEAAEQNASGCEVLLLRKLSEQLKTLCAADGIERLLCETSVSVAAVRRIQDMAEGFTAAPSQELEAAVTELRSRKSPEEIARIREAQRLTEEAFRYICGVIAPGRTEREIALELEFYIRRAGSEGPAFDFIAVAGENSSRPHGVPGDRAVHRGDFITLDYGAVVDGYRSDMTRTVAAGAVSEGQREVYETVLRANLAGLAAVSDGVACADADAAARGVIERAGYGERFTHSTGHGVGLDIHEPISLSPASKQILRAGNVVTVEPGIYLPGKFGVRIEDMVAVTEDGCENLTKASKELLIL